MICQVRSVWLLKCVPSESQSSGREQPHFLYLQNYGDTGMMCEDSSSACYGQSVCEAKINPAPKSIAKKLVRKESPLAAKDTIMAPRVSTPALMCFGSIINLALPTSRYEAKNIPNM